MGCFLGGILLPVLGFLGLTSGIAYGARALRNRRHPQNLHARRLAANLAGRRQRWIPGAPGMRPPGAAAPEDRFPMPTFPNQPDDEAPQSCGCGGKG